MTLRGPSWVEMKKKEKKKRAGRGNKNNLVLGM